MKDMHQKGRARGSEVLGKHRLSVGLTPQQISWLRREAKRLGVTIGELVRRLLDQVRDAKPAKEQRR